jgi:hypothetical protein
VVASVLPDDFARWTPRQQWQWLVQAGQRVSYGQWKAAVRQAGSSVAAGTSVASDEGSAWPWHGQGRHRR